MAIPSRRQAWLKALVATSVAGAFLVAGGPAESQVPVDSPPMYGADGAWANRILGGMNKPSVPVQGVWGEVIMSNARWVVLQNANGQQFPIDFSLIRQFVVRWPTRLDIAAPDAFLEVTGVDIGSNRVQTNHIDVYEGTARTLVSPTMLRMLGANRVITPLDLEQSQLYGAVFPFTPAEAGIPPRIHAVGNVIGLDPLRVGVDGNNWLAVLPSEEGLDMTQVTLGSPTFVKKGDLVYYIPEAANEKSLAVSRFILYKKVFYRSYVN
jgi:hypothetical protein